MLNSCEGSDLIMIINVIIFVAFQNNIDLFGNWLWDICPYWSKTNSFICWSIISLSFRR